MPPIGVIVFGIALVIDGNTLSVDDSRMRLEGIDVPDLAQQCERDSVAYACGADAAAHLATLLGSRRVICTIRGHEDGMPLARCEVGGRDLADAMLDDGWAFAAPGAGRNMVIRERQARDAKLGLWAGTAEPAWRWRMRNR